MRNNRIVIIAPSPETVGGVSVHAARLGRRLLQSGWQVAAIDTKAGAKGDRGLRRVRSLIGVLAAVLGQRARGYRLFHFHTSYNAIPFLLLAPLVKATGAKTALSIHAGDYVQQIERRPTWRAVHRLLFKCCDRLIAMNAAQAAELARQMAPGGRIGWASPFIAPSASLRPADAAPPSGGRRPTFRIVVVGLWQPLYRFEDVIGILPLIRRHLGSTPVELDIVAGTSHPKTHYRMRIHELITEYRESGYHITVHEDLPHDGMVAFLAKMDLLVRPASVDSFGLCVAESLFAGTPAIATDVCPRPRAATTYRVGDTPTLARLICTAADRRDRQRDAGSLLAPADDGFSRLQQYLLTLTGS